MSTKDKPDSSTVKPDADPPEQHDTSMAAEVHAGRRYSVGTTVKQGKRKLRYVETNDPKKGCRFL